MVETKRLGDIATYINGYAFKPDDWCEEGLPIIRIQDLTGTSYQQNYYKGDYPAKIEINDGDVLISWSASLGVHIWNRGKALLNQHIFKVVFDKVEVDKQYFVYAVQYNLENMLSKMHGATMKHIVKKDFDNIEVPFPTLAEQKRVASILTYAKDAIEDRKQQLAKLDNLVKSRFVEMFGDPKYNKSNLVKVGEIGVLTSGGTPTRAKLEYFEGSIRWYSAGELNSLYLPDSLEHISETALQQSSAKLFNKGTLMIGMYDTAALKMGILTEDSSSNQACANLNPKQGYNVVWLYYLFDIMKPIFLQERQGVRQKNLSLSKIKNFEVPFAPFTLQNEFADFVAQIDKLKVSVSWI